MGDFIDVSRLILEHAEGVRTRSSYLSSASKAVPDDSQVNLT